MSKQSLRRTDCSRRQILGGGLGISLCHSPLSYALQKTRSINIGAIRWDAWYDRLSATGRGVEYILAPKQFQYRMPFFAKVITNDGVFIQGTQESFDLEIKFAKSSGLSYWAYCWYPEQSALQKGWQFHQSSEFRALMNWCMVWQFSILSNRSEFGKSVDDSVDWFTQLNYQKVDDRPLLYLYIDGLDMLARSWDGDWGQVRLYLEKLYSRCDGRGVQRPYLIIMYGAPLVAAEICDRLGADGISNYIPNIPRVRSGSFDSLTKSVEQYWQQMAQANHSMIPICLTGWDTRPRNLRNPPWEHKGPGDPAFYIEPGNPDQIAAQIFDGMNFINDNNNTCLSRNLLVYSWDECAEGGGVLMPTFTEAGPNTKILDAFSKVVSEFSSR